MTCHHRLGSLTCDNAAPHDEEAVGNHTYTASWAADGRHDDEAGNDW